MNIQNGISVTIAVKKNLGNFENILLEVSATIVDVDPKDLKAWSELWSLVDDQVSAKINEIENSK